MWAEVGKPQTPNKYLCKPHSINHLYSKKIKRERERMEQGRETMWGQGDYPFYSMSSSFEQQNQKQNHACDGTNFSKSSSYINPLKQTKPSQAQSSGKKRTIITYSFGELEPLLLVVHMILITIVVNFLFIIPLV